MKLNERNLAYYATSKSPVDKRGFLFKKGDRNTSYNKRWFVLKGNTLFYFDNEESKEPLGVIILEGCRVELCESTEEFAFAIKFEYTKSKAYILAADNQITMESWVKALSRANFEYIRLVVVELQKQLKEMQMGMTSYKIQGVTEKNKQLSCNTHQFLSQDIHEKPVCSLLKDNINATWNNIPVTVANGSVFNCEEIDCDTMRYLPSGLEGSSVSGFLPIQSQVLPKKEEEDMCPSSKEGAESPTFDSFEKLHNFFGEEIVDLRAKWIEVLQKQL
ncbi:hypothetical protein XENTR_v10002566 [Xenopus tropicalis]|uniref:Sesquipedalian n=1 Tax=Xenopus tropicalis TaxID=8364 RepID=A0A803KA04_XENTR|nr:sesquipedalian-1 [Xenopus tropicalis]XP_031748585.1 sesquipedalian-1 [Xenopus tropicalis]KAE8635282.1 hypothetical protein XENTR_v10002566 [Xenopus tropicalis]|eukprot:XP_004910563.1 PREDICTED: sesquipedalian-1 [Xenopus tropicalis]